MKNYLNLILIFLTVNPIVTLAAGRIQDSDVKSFSDVGGAANVSRLINTSKIYDSLNNQQLSASISNGQLGGGGGGTAGGISSFLSGKNPDAEKGATTNFTNTGGALTVINTGQADGNYSFQFVSSAASQSASSTLVPIPALSYAKNGLVRFTYSTTNSDFILQVTNGTTTVAQGTLPATVGYQYGSVTFPIPSSGSLQVNVVSASAGTINFDDIFLGENFQIGSVSQAIVMGTVKITGCSTQFNSPLSVSTYGTLSTGAPTGCVYAVTGKAIAPSGNRPAISFASLPAGDYVISFEGSALIRAVNSSNQGTFQFTDGTITALENSVISSVTANTGGNGINQTFSYTTSVSNLTWEIYSKGDGASGSQQYVYGTNAQPGVIKLIYYPSSASQVINPNITPASWSGYTSITGVWSGTAATYADVSNATGISLVQKTNRNFGSVVTAAGSIPGITVAFPRVGNYQICAKYYAAQTAIGTTLISQLTDGTTQLFEDIGSSNVGSANTSYGQCATYTTSTTAPTTFKLQVRNSSGANGWNLGATFVTPSIQWNITELDAAMPSPILTGSVTSNSLGAERIERANIANSGTASISSQSGSWISSVTRNAAGDVTLNLSSAFGGSPSCTTSRLASGGPANGICVVNTQTTTAVNVQCSTPGSGVGADVPFSVICMGLR